MRHISAKCWTTNILTENFIIVIFDLTFHIIFMWCASKVTYECVTIVVVVVIVITKFAMWVR